MENSTKLNISSGAFGAIIGTGVGYALNSGDCFTTAVVATCGLTIGALTSQNINHKKKIKKLEKKLEKENKNATNSSYFDVFGYCFKAGTLVLVDNGYKNIEDIAEGDLVYSYNIETKTKELKKVVRTFINEGKEMLTISVNGAKMELTSNHTCFVNGDWTLASNIKIGDKLLDCDGNDLEVENVGTANSCGKVYNFEVEDNHNYFVTDLNILVHNDSSYDGF